MLHSALLVKFPESHRGQGINLRPEGKQANSGGRGWLIFIGPGSSAVRLFFDGTMSKMAIRKEDDRDLAFEVSHRKIELESIVLFWATGGDNRGGLLGSIQRALAWNFSFNPDTGTIAPYAQGVIPIVDQSLVLGIVDQHGHIGLVHKDDASRRLVFESGEALSRKLAELEVMKSKADVNKERLLLITSPSCDWLRLGAKGLCIREQIHSNEFGRGQPLRIAEAEKAVCLSFDGVPGDAMVIRKFSDPELVFEVSHREFIIGRRVTLWSSKHPCSFVLNADRSLSPFGHLDLAVGAEHGTDQLTLVARDDPMRLVFQSESEMEASTRLLREEQLAAEAVLAVMEVEAISRCTESVLNSLLMDGYVHLPGAVPEPLLRKAKKEINRAMGVHNGDMKEFGGHITGKTSAITDLFNASQMPFILQRLLGTPRGGGKYVQSAGQIALRFPGDLSVDFQVFEGHRKGWHIDGCANDARPGESDHFGKIHNFDALVGVLVADVPEPMSGELCCYPGSHWDLAEYFKRHGLTRLRNEGAKVLPNGAQTDTIFSRPPVHCTGKAGDVFMLNYMTAHFVAPNTSPDIRYAVYFRVQGPSFRDGQNEEAMLDPVKNWRLDSC